MRAGMLKCLALLGILLTATAADCLGPCAPEYVHITLNDFEPADGTVVAHDTITFTVSGTEEATARMFSQGYSLDWAQLERWDGSHWTYVKQIHTWDKGPWETAGTCSDIRPIAMTFEDVSLQAGQNRFRVAMWISASDVAAYWTYSSEVTYVYQP